MARTPATIDSLTKLLDQSSRPIYVVDSQRRIVYCNPALAAWIDLEPKRIVGRHVEYHSESSADAKADGPKDKTSAPITDLCPPPKALAGEPCVGTISCLARDGRLLHRAAEFVPLNLSAGAKQMKPRDADGQRSAVLVFLAGEDLSTQEIVGDLSGQPTADELHRTIRRFRRGQASRYSIQSLLGSSSAMKKVRAQVEAAAASGANTLVHGARGTGRTQMALAIHYHATGESEAHLIPLDCELLTDDLLERTLDKLRPARAKTAARPTLLLKNVEVMSAAHQKHLLATIRQSVIDARIIATIGPVKSAAIDAEETSDANESAASDDKKSEIAANLPAAIDPALLDAISTITICVPRLIDHLDDLPVLAQFFLETCNRVSSKQVGSLRSDTLDSLALYSWPGELEQLRDVVVAAHEACTSHEITPANLPPIFYQAFRAAAHVRRQPERIVLDDLLASIEKEAIVRALAQTDGNKSEAANLLGMTRPRFYRRLVQLGMAGEVKEGDPQPELPEFIEHDATE